ncbi:ribosome maturation factor RimP [Nocardioides gilvus]|uniref:ribosome maturation factor RimP n=1 Tax=Nocardioides gilvus TaxID=1735589 RepID=UPI000D74CED1|nr:ribosome maturation factor RimP [Nocardioides gilvus]
MSNAKTDATRERVEEALLVPLGELDLDVEAVELSAAGKRSVLRVAVDKDGGVNMDDVAEATRTISDLLDEQDLMGLTPYLLEVTSRGVDRPLTLPRHWRRNETRLVKVTLVEGGVVTGRVGASDDEKVVLDVDGAAHEVVYSDIAKAIVQVEFNRKKVVEPELDDDQDDEDEDF